MAGIAPSQVSSATLSLYLAGQRTSAAGSYSVRRLTSPWGEGATWNKNSFLSQPVTDWNGAGAHVASWAANRTISGSASGRQTWDVTSAVRSWVAQPASNHGLMVRPASEPAANELRFVSSEDANVKRRPELSIRWLRVPWDLEISPCFGECASARQTESPTPRLSAQVSLPDDVESVLARFEVAPVDASGIRGAAVRTNDVATPVGQSAMWEVDSPLAPGSYAFRVGSVDTSGGAGTNCGAGSSCVWSGWTGFEVLPTVPPAPVVSSPTHPEGTPSAGREVRVEWAAADGVAPASWAVTLDQEADTVPSTETSQTWLEQEVDPGLWWVHVRARDQLGRWSPVTHLRMEVLPETPLITTPVSGEMVWVEHAIRFPCEPGGEFEVVLSGPEGVQHTLGPITGGPICETSWDPAELDTNGERLYPGGGWTLQVRDSDGDAVGEPTTVQVKSRDQVDVLELILNRHQVGLIDDEELADQLLGVIRPESLPPELRTEMQHNPPSLEQLNLTMLQVREQLPAMVRADLFTVSDRVAGSSTCEAGPFRPASIVGKELVETARPCVLISEHFQLLYDPAEFPNGLTLPRKVEEAAAALEDAHDVYSGLGFDLPAGPTAVWFVDPDDNSWTGGVRPPGFAPSDEGIYLFTSGGDWGSRLVRSLVHHEFFHVVQWQYMSLTDFGLMPLPGILWWMEATASWGAMQADATIPGDSDELGAYAEPLPRFLSRSHLRWDVFDNGEQPQYGAFVLPAYLQQRVPDGVERTWQLIGETTSPNDAITQVLTDASIDWGGFVRDFRWSAYLLDHHGDLGFANPDRVAQWRRAMDELPQTRPPFTGVELVENDVVSGQASVAATGAHVVELAMPEDSAFVTGEVHLQVSGPATAVVEVVPVTIEPVSGDAYRAIPCGTVSTVDGAAVVRLDKAECDTLAMLITNTDTLTSPSLPDTVTWEATLRPASVMLESGNLRMEVTAAGRVVGLERVDNPVAMLSGGFGRGGCNGWAVMSDAVLGPNPKVTADWCFAEVPPLSETSAEVVSFTSDGVTAQSVVREADLTTVTHTFSPHPLSDDLYQVEVEVNSPLGLTDVRYQRSWKWSTQRYPDIELPMDPPSTISSRPVVGNDDGFLAATDNWVAPIGSPMTETHPPSFYVNDTPYQSGYFEEAQGRGGRMEINLGAAPGLSDPATATFYHGATTTPTAAVTAISGSGAAAYHVAEELRNDELHGVGVIGVGVPEAAR